MEKKNPINFFPPKKKKSRSGGIEFFRYFFNAKVETIFSVNKAELEFNYKKV